MREKKIRVVHIVQSPGGVDRYISSLLKYMGRDKFENILICSYDYSDEKYKDLIDEIIYVDMIREISFMKDFKAICKIRNLLKKSNPDVVYCHSSKAGALGRIANLGLRNRCVYNPHGWAFNMRGKKIKQMIYAAIEKILAPFCDSIVCISDAEKESAIDKRICRKDKLRVIYNGIDFSEYQQRAGGLTRESVGISNSAFVIGAVGRLSEQKAPDIFVRAARLIKDQIPNAFFVMVGDGEQRSDIEAMIKDYRLDDSFYITGWVDNPMEYVKLFDVATLLSRWEGFGLVLPEYMLAKKPIVATKVDAIPDIISNYENGLLVEPDNYEDVAESIISIWKSEELKNLLITNGDAVVHKKFNVERVVEEHEDLFEDLIMLNV